MNTVLIQSVCYFSDVGQSYINLTVDALNVRVKAGEEHVQWVVNVDATPIPSYIWFDKSHEEIKPQNSMKYKIEERKGKTQITLIIYKISIHDAGTYEFRAYNDKEERTLNLTLTVTGMYVCVCVYIYIVCVCVCVCRCRCRCSKSHESIKKFYRLI
jgi:hypothetical protein